uniref:Uncharacterized protein n=1 Tax=Anguilla anguilla TaxID=7936 RepID=A0A0E9RM46_ANGAN
MRNWKGKLWSPEGTVPERQTYTEVSFIQTASPVANT